MSIMVQHSLVVGDTKIPCHLPLLVSAAPNLQTVVTHKTNKSTSEIRLPDDFHVKAVQSVVKFINEGTLDVSSQDALTVLKCADLFGAEGAKEACLRCISQTISPVNCIQLRKLAMEYSASQLAGKCDAVINRCSSELLSQKEFLNLPRIQVNVDVSSQLFEFSTDAAIMDKLAPKVVSQLEQMAADPAQKYLEEATVHLVLMPDLSLAQFPNSTRASQLFGELSPEKPSPLLKLMKSKSQSSPARKLILTDSIEDTEEEEEEETSSSWKLITVMKMSAISSVCLVERDSSLCVLNINLFASDTDDKIFPASPTTGLCATSGTPLFAQMNTARSGFAAIAVEGGFLAMGGYNREGCLISVERYHFAQNCWEEVGEMRKNRARFAAVELDGVVYAIGGSDGRRELSSVEAFDLTTQSWRKLNSSMPTLRSCFTATKLNDQIYAIGGSYYSRPLKTAEVFDPATEQWRSLHGMLVPRSDLAAASCNGKVYAIGGQTLGWKCLAEVECYDLGDKSWKKVANMNVPRRNAAAITIEDKIYVIGGYNGSTALNSVEVYDPMVDTWTCAAPMHVERSGATAVAFDMALYVIGGYSGSTFLNSIECYNVQAQQWTSFM